MEGLAKDYLYLGVKSEASSQRVLKVKNLQDDKEKVILENLFADKALIPRAYFLHVTPERMSLVVISLYFRRPSSTDFLKQIRLISTAGQELSPKIGSSLIPTLSNYFYFLVEAGK